MKKSVYLFFVIILFSCASKPIATANTSLYEVLTEQPDGGASFRFYEILTDEKEMKMLLGDPNLKNKITAADIKTSNFVILNMGEHPSNGYLIKVKSVEGTSDKIIIQTEDSHSPQNEIIENTFPYTIVKINSKKAISIK